MCAMRAQPRSALFKGTLNYDAEDGHISIPVFLYKMSSDIRAGGVEFHLYHTDCSTRVRYNYYCPVCDITVPKTEVTKMAEYGDAFVLVSREEVKEALGGDSAAIEIIHPIPLDDIPRLIDSGVISPVDHYLVRGFKTGSKKREALPSVERQLRLLFDALDKNNQGLYVSVPVSGGIRMGILFPTGNLITIRYQEEIREPIPLMYGPGEGYDKREFAAISKFFKAKERPIMEAPSGQEQYEKVAALLDTKEKVITARPIEAPAEGLPAPLVDIRGFLDSLTPKTKKVSATKVKPKTVGSKKRK